jgi:hypothetical protein
MAFNDLIHLVDIEPVLDKKTGKTHLQIVRETPIYADRQEVGMEEYYSAAGEKRVLIATYEIPAHSYRGEKYILTHNRTRQFEISRVGKGRSLGYLKLPVTKVANKNLLGGMKSE